jgi:hypothetical protein
LIYQDVMRGDDQKQAVMFSYLTPAQRILANHPARRIRALVDRALALIAGAISQQLLESVLIEAREHELLSEEHFTVDGTLIQAWAPTRSIGKRSLSRRCAPAKWRRTSANM